ncbi:MAG TPA: ABC transporter permease [Candidatus Lokiarchaeia archaeon]|nr:ABC transporter permease [Candidatus Lokiarchaeia archaeon]
MKFRDEFSYAIAAIRTRKSRAALTITGIVIGIAAVVAMISLGNGFSASMQTQLNTGTASNVVAITKGSGFDYFGGGGGPGGFQSSSSSGITFYNSDISQLEAYPGIELAVPVITRTGWTYFDGQNNSITVTGVDFGEYATLYPTTFIADQGAISTATTNTSWVVGYNVYNDTLTNSINFQLGDTLNFTWSTTTAINATESITINQTYSASVGGVLGQIGFSAGFGGGSGPSDRDIYLPFAEAQALFDPTNTGVLDSIILELTNSSTEAYTLAATAVNAIFGSGASVRQPTSLVNTLSGTFTTVTDFLTAVAGISLIVAGIGIMNIMLVTLMERTREIGILKAHGASNSNIMSTFLIEVTLFGIIGGGLGLIGGYLVGLLFGQNIASLMIGGRMMGGRGGAAGYAQSLVITPLITWQLVLEAFGFGLLISLVFGMYPAWRASRLKPVESLKSE